MTQKVEVYTIAAMLYSPLLKNDLEHIGTASNIKTILCNPDDNLALSDPADYHLTISYIEFHQEDWSEDIPAKLQTLISSMLQDQKIGLPFRRLGVLYKYFFAEFAINNLIYFKADLLNALKKEFPQGIYGFEQEYFPHVTLARFYVPPETPRIIKRELISTSIRRQEIVQPKLVNPLLIDKDWTLKIGVKVRESNFLE